MAAKKFEKGSPEWNMFQDFWQMCQRYWIIERDNDEYWEQLVQMVDVFTKKYKDVPLAKELALGFAAAKDREAKDGTRTSS
jgi:hypothetical protein